MTHRWDGIIGLYTKQQSSRQCSADSPFRPRLAPPLVLTALICHALAGCGDGDKRQVLQNKGSDTLVNIAQSWAETYQNHNPDQIVVVSGGGSGTGIAALINGTVDIANSSRLLKPSEIEQARSRGHEPVEHIVGFDAIAVFLHPDNPLQTLSTDQLIEIYGDGGRFTSWTDLGVEVPGCDNQTIVVVSRQNNSGTYAYFRDIVLGKRDYRLGTHDMHGSKDVVELVENTPCAIGYSGLAYATQHTSMACITTARSSGCVNPSVETAADGSYPVARPLFMYTNGAPTGAIKTYLDWIVGDVGQCLLVEKGYAPMRTVNCRSGA